MNCIDFFKDLMLTDWLKEDLIAEMEFIADNLPDTFVMHDNWVDTAVERHKYYSEGI